MNIPTVVFGVVLPVPQTLLSGLATRYGAGRSGICNGEVTIATEFRRQFLVRGPKKQ